MSVTGSSFAAILLGGLIILGIGAAAVVIIIIALSRKGSNNVPAAEALQNPENSAIRNTLGEELRRLRTEHNMTQEFAAEKLGISRQAISKWENGTSEPSTTNLIAIAKLYDIAPEELLRKLV